LYYETIFIVNPDISQENTEKLTDDLVAKIEKVGGRIVKRENWGSRPLSYSIAKRKRGNYVLLVTDGEPQALQALEHAISLEERIIRTLTTRLTELSDKPSPLMRRAKPAEAKTEEAAAEPAEAKTEEAAAEPAEAKAEEEAAEPAEAKAEEAAAEPVEAKAEEAVAEPAKAKAAKTKKATKAKKTDGAKASS